MSATLGLRAAIAIALLPAPVLAQAQAPVARHAPGDPLENVNRRIFSFNEGLDRRLLRPAALGYAKAVPRPVRSGIRNVFSNLTEPVVFLNDILQLKPGRAGRTLLRFAVNTIFGIGGLFDVAKGEKIPHRNNGFGNTLARYGVKSGPYLYLPLLGPSTLRDMLGGQADALVLPVAVGSPFDRFDYQAGRAVVTGLDQRAEADADLTALFAGALDPYATLRSVYQQNRANEIAAVRGGPAATPALDDPLTDPDAPDSPTDASTTELPAPAADPLADPLLDPATPQPSAGGSDPPQPAGSLPTGG